MKEFIFISDFDGTITNMDFDEVLLNGRLKNRGFELSNLLNSNKITVAEYLSIVFGSVDCTEDELLKDILSIKIDKHLNDFIRFIRENNGDFVIASSGSLYYINILLKHYGIEDVKVFSNKGVYKNRALHLIFDKESPIYPSEFGIDKKKIVESYKNEHKKVYYAGDGRTDLNAALISDIVFTKGTLAKSLDNLKIANIKFNNFLEVKKFIQNEIILN